MDYGRIVVYGGAKAWEVEVRGTVLNSYIYQYYYISISLCHFLTSDFLHSFNNFNAPLSYQLR